MTEAIDHMAPAASPGEVSKKAGVRRVNNLPMVLIGGVMAAFLLVMMLVAADRAARQQADAVADDQPVGAAMLFAQGIAGGDVEGIVPAAAPVVPDRDAALATPSIVAQPARLEQPPPPPAGLSREARLNSPQRDEEAQRIRMAKLQMLQEAVKARTGVQVLAPRSVASAPGVSGDVPRTRQEMAARIAQVRQQIEAVRSDDPTAAYQARLAQVRGMIDGQTGGAGGSSAPALIRTAASGAGDSYGEFGNNARGDRWRLDSRPEAPGSPYELRAGFVLPATLISGINAELPGQIMAQVSQNVYDTPVGRHLLLPQGSRLVGSYSSDVAYGQARVLVAWQRIVFPDGKAMDIGAMPGADSAGYAGFHDQVNNHYVRIFGSAVLMSAITAGFTLSQDTGEEYRGNRSNSQRASDALSEALGQQLGQVTGQMIAKNLNMAPTLEIRPGYRFNVIVTKDMTFSKPYQSFDY